MKYLILGGGPAGLTFANRLLTEHKEDSFLVLEKENKAGGLCRTEIVDDGPLDIGGGHILDVRRPHVTDYLFQFLDEKEWDRYLRDSRIDLYGNVISHPIEANLWQLPLEEQVLYLESIARAGCNKGEPLPENFVTWIYWKLGKKIADDYMLPYNKKMFGDNLNYLGTYWLEKLPSVSFRETLLSCLEKRVHGKQPAHAEFYYPKQYGYGEVWLRMAATLGDRIKYNEDICGIDFDSNTVLTEAGKKYKADIIVTTIPWLEFKDIDGMPKDLQASIRALKHTSVQIKYYPENIETEAQWTYFPDPHLSYHRIIYRHTYKSHWNGYWTETNIDRVQGEIADNVTSFFNEYAYPLNTIDKPKIMEKLLSFAASKNVYGLGRWGEHQHYNSDLVVELAMNLATKLH